jgi:hypothetical protein
VSIRIAAAIAAFALLWYASLRTAGASRGAVNVSAKALFLILTCLACIMIGFLLPMAPGLRAVIGAAFWAGLLASAARSPAWLFPTPSLCASSSPRRPGQWQQGQRRQAKRRDRAIERRLNLEFYIRGRACA